LRQQQGDIRVLEDECDALRRIHGVHGNVGGARLQDAENPHDSLKRALEEKPHERVRTRAQRSQVARQPVGPAVELCVGQPLPLEYQGRLIRRSRRLRFYQLVQTEVATGKRDRGVIPIEIRCAVPSHEVTFPMFAVDADFTRTNRSALS